MRGRASGRPYDLETARAELADGVLPIVVALRLGCDLSELPPIPTVLFSPRAVAGSPTVPGTLALVSPDMPAGTP